MSQIWCVSTNAEDPNQSFVADEEVGMKRINPLLILSAALLVGLLLSACQPIVAPTGGDSAEPAVAANEAENSSAETARVSTEDKIANAMSAGPPAIAQEATILDYPAGYPWNWPDEPLAEELIELRPGSNGWTCIVDIPNTPGNDPMCLNETYLKVLKARHALVDSPSSGIGIGYMLQEGSPVGSPPHMMIFVPGSNDGLAAFSTEPGPAPWVMFPDTSHAHLMVTRIPRPETVSATEDKIANAMSAGPLVIAQEATILDYPEGYPWNWPDEPLPEELIELRPGSNGWTCIVDIPNTPGNDPMCLNETYLKVLKARHALMDSPSSGIGIGYMLQEGSPVGSPPHAMIFVPGSNDGLAAFGTEPGPTPWVMFQGTSHAHLMVTFLYEDN